MLCLIKFNAFYVRTFLMKSKLFLQLIIFFFMFVFLCRTSVATPTPENEAKSWVNTTGYKLIGALSDTNLQIKYQVLDKMFNEDIDTAYIARFVLGKHWRELNEKQQKDYLSMFRRYALSLYKSYPLDFDLKGLDFTVLSARVNGNYTDVSCNVILPEKYATNNIKSLALEFKLTKDNQKIRIVDLKIGESSLLLTYRGRFAEMIKNADGDMEWFLEDFSDLTISNEKNIEQNLENAQF